MHKNPIPTDDCFPPLMFGPQEPPNQAKKLTTPPEIKGKGNGKKFEAHVFATLLDNAKNWEIKEIYQCKNVRMDGYLVMNDGKRIPLEIKETLGWASLTSATFQLLAGPRMLGWSKEELQSGLIIFEHWSSEWKRRFPNDLNDMRK